ncbi:hypothetical protein PBY51_016875 [Eleginops maclovinus]|uniref:Uncharacterized protein n=1 Tax=Eleginops maclovinus TaxID=56733 RepID=A0AAN7WMG7_ELEMC|nr:hypothetical protein PBY51_016875 [Eleginops maclovinus]
MWLSADVFSTSSGCSFPRMPSVGERAHSASNMVRNIETSFTKTPGYSSEAERALQVIRRAALACHRAAAASRATARCMTGERAEL